MEYNIQRFYRNSFLIHYYMHYIHTIIYHTFGGFHKHTIHTVVNSNLISIIKSMKFSKNIL